MLKFFALLKDILGIRILQEQPKQFNYLSALLGLYCSKTEKILTLHKVRTSINLPDNLTTMRAIDATVLVVQKVFRQNFIYEHEQRKRYHQLHVMTTHKAESQTKNMFLDLQNMLWLLDSLAPHAQIYFFHSFICEITAVLLKIADFFWMEF